MKKIFFRDDFKVVIRFEQDGEAVKVPALGFLGRVFTSGTLESDRIVFCRERGIDTGFKIDTEGRIVVAIDGHHLAPGQLLVWLEFLIPSEEYADETLGISRQYEAEAELVLNVEDNVTMTNEVELTVEVPELVETEKIAGAAEPPEEPEPSGRVVVVNRREPVMRRGLLNLRNHSGDIYRLLHHPKPDIITGRYIATVKIRVPVDGTPVNVGQYFDENRDFNLHDIRPLHPHIFAIDEDDDGSEGWGDGICAVQIKNAWPYISISRFVSIRSDIKVDYVTIGIEYFLNGKIDWVTIQNGKIKELDDTTLGQPSEPKLRKVMLDEFKQCLEIRKTYTVCGESCIIIVSEKLRHSALIEVQRRRSKKIGLSKNDYKRIHRWRRSRGNLGKFGVIRVRRRSLKGYVGDWSYYSYVLRGYADIKDARIQICEI